MLGGSKNQRMKTFALRAWCGPTLLAELAAKIRESWITVSCEGTEHIFVSAEGFSPEAAAHNVCAAMMLVHKTDFHLRFRQV